MTAEDAMQLKGHDFLEDAADFEVILKICASRVLRG